MKAILVYAMPRPASKSDDHKQEFRELPSVVYADDGSSSAGRPFTGLKYERVDWGLKFGFLNTSQTYIATTEEALVVCTAQFSPREGSKLELKHSSAAKHVATAVALQVLWFLGRELLHVQCIGPVFKTHHRLASDFVTTLEEAIRDIRNLGESTEARINSTRSQSVLLASPSGVRYLLESTEDSKVGSGATTGDRGGVFKVSPVLPDMVPKYSSQLVAKLVPVYNSAAARLMRYTPGGTEKEEEIMRTVRDNRYKHSLRLHEAFEATVGLPNRAGRRSSHAFRVIVTDMCAGGSLDKFAGIPHVETVHRVAMGLFRALAELHSAKPPILHKDVKLANVGLTAPISTESDSTWRVVLLDHGAAEQTGALPISDCYGGTKWYASPENTCSPASDVWAAGLTVLYFALGAGHHEMQAVMEADVQSACQEPGHVESRVAKLARRWSEDYPKFNAESLISVLRLATHTNPETRITAQDAYLNLKRNSVPADPTDKENSAWVPPAVPPELEQAVRPLFADPKTRSAMLLMRGGGSSQ